MRDASPNRLAKEELLVSSKCIKKACCADSVCQSHPATKAIGGSGSYDDEKYDDDGDAD